MAIYNEILAPRYARMLQKLFGIKGSVPAKQLAGEIATAFPLFNGRENRLLEGWNTFGARIAVGPVAAQDSVARLTLASGTKTIVVVEGMKFQLSAAGEVVFEYANAQQPALAAVVTPANFDNRSNPPGAGSNGAQAVLSAATNVAQGAHNIFDDVVLSGVNITSNELVNYENQEIQLLPGSSLQVRTLTLNISITLAIRWRERFLEDSELAS